MAAITPLTLLLVPAALAAAFALYIAWVIRTTPPLTDEERYEFTVREWLRLPLGAESKPGPAHNPAKCKWCRVCHDLYLLGRWDAERYDREMAKQLADAAGQADEPIDPRFVDQARQYRQQLDAHGYVRTAKSRQRLACA